MYSDLEEALKMRVDLSVNKKDHRKGWSYKKFGWAAYPSYQVPFQERRVPFLLVKFQLQYKHKRTNRQSSCLILHKRPDLQ